MNTKFTAYEKSTGRVFYSGTAAEVSMLRNLITEVHEGESHTDGYFEGGVHPAVPLRPSEAHTFNWQTKQWEDPRTLQDFKEIQWTLIKQARSQAEYAGFTWDGSVFDSDAISQNRITGAVTLAMLSPEFTIGWVLADNTVRSLNQTDMMQVGAALGQHVALQFNKAVLLRNAIELATSAEEVLSIQWAV